MLSSKGLKEIVTAARPIIERQLDDAETIAAFRDKVADAGGDWSALKALIKAQIQDERDESGEGKRVKKILDKAGFSTDYAELLGWSNMNEKNFSAEERIDPLTGEFLDDEPVDAKLIETVAAGAQTEIGRAALIAAVDIMIEQVEAEESQANPVEEGEHGGCDEAVPTVEAGSRASEESERQRASMVGFADDCRTGGKEQSDASAAPVGDAAAYAHGIPANSSSPESVSPNGEPSSSGANAGGGHVESRAERARNAATNVANAAKSVTAGETAPNSTAKPKYVLRPHCLNPGEACGGYSDKHCHACTVAMRKREQAEEVA